MVIIYVASLGRFIFGEVPWGIWSRLWACFPPNCSTFLLPAHSDGPKSIQGPPTSAHSLQFRTRLAILLSNPHLPHSHLQDRSWTPSTLCSLLFVPLLACHPLLRMSFTLLPSFPSPAGHSPWPAFMILCSAFVHRIFVNIHKALSSSKSEDKAALPNLSFPSWHIVLTL